MQCNKIEVVRGGKRRSDVVRGNQKWSNVVSGGQRLSEEVRDLQRWLEVVSGG